MQYDSLWHIQTLGNCQLFGNEYRKSRFLKEEKFPVGSIKSLGILKIEEL